MINYNLYFGAIYMMLAIAFMFAPFPYSLFGLLFFSIAAVKYTIWSQERNNDHD